MNSLSKHAALLKRFSTFELSYETVSHKKVCPSDSIAVAIPLGRKYFLWYTYREGGSEDVCYVLGLDKDKQICSVDTISTVCPKGFSIGTVVYCTLYQKDETSPSVYIAEDIYQFRGTALHNLCFGDRIGFLRNFAQAVPSVALPIMWFATSGSEQTATIPDALEKKAAYVPHHIQYREVRRVAPYVNVALPKKGLKPVAVSSSADVAQKLHATAVLDPIPSFDYGKPAFRYPATFQVMADSQLDLYHLYAYGGIGRDGKMSKVYCGLPAIQSYKTSVFMNRIFRRIRENDNLDLAEESEDEADFENTDTNKFVDLGKVAQIECVFSTRHKKWIPVKLSTDKIVHIEKLVSTNGQQRNPFPKHNHRAHHSGRGGFRGK